MARGIAELPYSAASEATVPPPPTALDRHSNSACRSRVAACKLLHMHCELRARCVHCMHAPCTDCTTTAFGRLTEEQAAERCARANGSMAAHLEAATRWHAAEVNLPTYLPTGASICLHTCLNTSVPAFPATCMPAYLPIPRCDCWAWSAPRSRRSVRRHGQKRLTRPPLGHHLPISQPTYVALPSAFKRGEPSGRRCRKEAACGALVPVNILMHKCMHMHMC